MCTTPILFHPPLLISTTPHLNFFQLFQPKRRTRNMCTTLFPLDTPLLIQPIHYLTTPFDSFQPYNTSSWNVYYSYSFRYSPPNLIHPLADYSLRLPPPQRVTFRVNSSWSSLNSFYYRHSEDSSTFAVPRFAAKCSKNSRSCLPSSALSLCLYVLHFIGLFCRISSLL